MARIWLVIAALALAGCTGQKDGYLAANMPQANWFPPAQYDHSYDGLVVAWSVDQKDIMAECQTDRPDAMGCSWIEEDSVFGEYCVVVRISKPVGDITPQAVLRHEIGHCNGWKHP